MRFWGHSVWFILFRSWVCSQLFLFFLKEPYWLAHQQFVCEHWACLQYKHLFGPPNCKIERSVHPWISPCLVYIRSQNWDPTSWKWRPKSFQVSVLETASVKIQAPKLRSQILRTMSWKLYPAVAVPVLVRLPRKEWRVGQTNGQTDSRSTADTKRKQRIKVKQMSKQTPQRPPVVEISGTNCSSGSGSGPVTTQRVTGRTDRQTSEFIYKIREVELCANHMG
jgi:hypothetical protein